MTSTTFSDLTYADPRTETSAPFGRGFWIAAATIAVLFVGIFWSNLARIWIKTNPFTGEMDWGHAPIVPLVGLYYLYLHREQLSSAKIKSPSVLKFSRNRVISASICIAFGLFAWFVLPKLALSGSLSAFRPYLTSLLVGIGALGILALAFNWGIATLLGGLLCFQWGIFPGQNDYLKDLGMVLTLFGVVLALGGWDIMRHAWFPIAFLVCALPWPGLLYSQVAMPLQQLSAAIAVWVMQVFDVNTYQEGTKIVIDHGIGKELRVLNVAEACAGIKSLMTFVSIGAAVAFLSSRPMWQRLFIVAMTLPIAVLCNAMRVSGQGLLDYYVSEQWSSGFAHQFAGMIMLIPAFLLLLGLTWLLDKIFVDDVAPAGEKAKVAA